MIESHDLGVLIESNIPLIVIESDEEDLVLEMISNLALKRSLACFSWTITEGLIGCNLPTQLKNKRAAVNTKFDDYSHEPDKILNRIKFSRKQGIYALCDFHPYLVNEPRRVRTIKDIALRYRQLLQTVIFISHEFPIPPEIKHFTAQLEIALPGRDELVNMIKDESLQWSRQNKGEKIKSDPKTFNQFVNNLQGVTFTEAKRLISRAIQNGTISKSDVPRLNRAKFKLMDMGGILSYEHDIPSFEEVGGLDNLKKWLKKRTIAFQSENKNLDNPKGILLIGVQGSGKSLAAKAVAENWNLPLLRLDFGTLYNKYFGETEKNLRESLKLSEVMAPCVLWMDEIEKGISPDDNDQGVSKRLLSSLLTWMAEKKKPVFIVATANDIQKLPPELIRKGRMDEIFFVDLPDQDTRQKIFSIHMHKRKIDQEMLDLQTLAEAAEGFSGAEIEQSIVSALYSNNGNKESITTEDILSEIRNTVPLSITMDNEIRRLRAWAQKRTVPAN